MRTQKKISSYKRPARLNYRDEIIANLDEAISSHETGNQEYEVWIRQHSRTTRQNDKFHKLVREISIATGESFGRVKFWIVMEALGPEVFEINNKVYEKPHSTSSLAQDQMTLLISFTEVIHAQYT